MLAAARRVAVLLLSTLLVASRGVVNHQDTVRINRCFSVAAQLPLQLRLLLGPAIVNENRLCLEGWLNLCTQDANLTVQTAGGQPVVLAAGDGSNASTFSNTNFIPLPDIIFPGTACDNSSIRLREALVSRRGLTSCLDMRISCLPFAEISLPCVDVGDDTDSCTAIEQCECTQHRECGWCAATATCTRMLGVLPVAANNFSRFSDTDPVCGCGSGLVTARSDPLNTCAPRRPPALPPYLPPPPPHLPLPPGLPPWYPPFVDPSWLNGIALERNIAASQPLLVQWVLWACCTGVLLIALILCKCGEASRAKRRSPTGQFNSIVVSAGFGSDAGPDATSPRVHTRRARCIHSRPLSPLALLTAIFAHAAVYR